MIVRDALYIDGQWQPAQQPGARTVENPATEETIGSVPTGGAADADRAVAAAQTAFPAWAATSVEERAKLLARLTDALEARADDLARLVTAELGAPLPLSRAAHVGKPVGTFRYMAEAAPELLADEEMGNSLVVREPVGVVAAITPWNFPLLQIADKVAPALAAGCTVVLKPADLTPLCALALADIVHEVGIPAGVLNVVTGRGAELGAALASHPDVDMVSFTGSTGVGRQIQATAAETIKRVTLELGGKSAAVILDDADFAAVLPGVLGLCFVNSGQACIALSRILVPRHRLAEAEEIAAAVAAAFTTGDPLADGTKLGPLVSAAQREQVLGYIRTGIDEGARCVAGGTERPDGCERGHYVRPTVLSPVDNTSTVGREEIFGPVAAIVAYDNDDHAVALANDTIYGLSGGVWSADPVRAEAVARRLRTGAVTVNGAPSHPHAPFGGYKQSGLGRERGRFGLAEFTELKSIHRPSER